MILKTGKRNVGKQIPPYATEENCVREKKPLLIPNISIRSVYVIRKGEEVIVLCA